ncbi:MAG: S8 family serine peptidase [Leucobacter sp.]
MSRQRIRKASKRAAAGIAFAALVATLAVTPVYAEEGEEVSPPVAEAPSPSPGEPGGPGEPGETEVVEAEETEEEAAVAPSETQAPEEGSAPAVAPTEENQIEGPSQLPGPIPSPPEGTGSDKAGLIDGELRAIYDRWVAGEETPDVVDGKICVEVIPAAGFDALAAALAAFGAADTVDLDTDGTFGGLAVTTLRVDDLPEVEELPEVTQLRVPLVLSAPEEPDPVADPGVDPAAGAALPLQTGAAGSDLIKRVRSASWNKAGVKGSKVKVGIIDYFGTTEWSAAKAKGDVKNPAGTFCRRNGASCNIWQQSSAHGVGVAETILDIAPNVQLYLATVETMEDHRAAVNYFSSKGVRIVSRSLAAELDGRGDGTGPAAAVLDYAVKKKMTWFNSAGNQGVQKMPASSGFQTRGGYWRGEWSDANGNGYLDFAPGNDILIGSCSYFQGMRWNDWGSNATDYDLHVYYYWGGWNYLTSMTTKQGTGAKPLETGTINCSGVDYIGFVITKVSNGNGTSGDRIELMTNGAFFDYVRNPGSASQPFVDTKNKGGLAVGSIDVVTKNPEPNSARGPLIDGRIKPDISAAANFTTIAYNGRFNGTSSATPAAAGAAALILSKNPKWSPTKLGSYMRTHANYDRGAKGPDNTYGAGELRMPLLNTKAPKAKGAAKVGRTLKVSAGKWTEGSLKRSYQWLRNGKKISGATGKSYKLTSKDRGKKISVRETVKRSSYKNATATSARTGKVK